MTAQEMHNAIKLRLQKVGSNAFDTFLSEEIDVYINLSVDDFVDERFLPEANRIGEGFEQSQKRIDDLRTLVVKDKVLTVTYVTDNAALSNFYVDRGAFPNDYMHLISTRCKVAFNMSGIDYTVTGGKRVPDGTENTDYATARVGAKSIQSDDILMILNDPFNTTRVQKPIYDINEQGIDVYTNDKFLVDDIIINYLREPATVSLSGGVDCDLPRDTHSAIVDKTAKKMASDIGELGAAQKIESLTDQE